ncbi:MAG: hypothetical protein LBI59_04575 [Candidatus Accumulibacter sp.]|nr:hypothetical protein [Accumulibacter sp.]
MMTANSASNANLNDSSKTFRIVCLLPVKKAARFFVFDKHYFANPERAVIRATRPGHGVQGRKTGRIKPVETTALPGCVWYPLPVFPSPFTFERGPGEELP